MHKTLLIAGAFIIILIAAGAYWMSTQANQVPSTSTTETATTTNQLPVTSGENPEPGSVHDLPAEPAAVEARNDLAAKLSVDAKSIVIMRVEEKTWSDGCLGLGGPAESCLAALVEGFRVELQAQGKTYIYRTDATGASVRQETSL